MAIPEIQSAVWVDKLAPDAKIEIRHDVPVPKPKLGEVLVKMECSGVCHSDTSNIYGRHHMSVNIPGHEGVGTVVEPVTSPLYHARVGIRWIVSTCLDCEICAVNETSCPKQKNSGRNVDGTLRQYVSVDERFAVRIPEEIGSEVAAVMMCAGISQFSAVKKSSAKAGEWLILTGAGGGLGHLGLQIARNRGIKVIAIDSGTEKKDLCLSLGAAAFIDYMTDDVSKTVSSLTNTYGAHAAICTAGSAASYTQTIPLVRPQGTVVCVGLPGLDYKLPLGPMDMVQRGLTLTGSSNGTRADTKELLQMVVRGEVVPKIEVFAFEQIGEVVRRLEGNEVVGRAVVKIPE